MTHIVRENTESGRKVFEGRYRMTENKDMIKEILNYFNDKEVRIIYLFGSAARGELRENSDIDIAIIGEYDSLETYNMQMELSEILDRDVDLINFNKVNINFQSEIISTGKVIYCKDEEEKDFFELRILSNYLSFEEDRKIVIDAIKERGSVFFHGKSSIV